MKKRIILCGLGLLVLSAIAAPAQELTERAKVGNAIEDLTYIRTGPYAGKVAFLDGWSVFLYDLIAGTYEKLFSNSPQQIGLPARGIDYISQGEFAGNFILPKHFPTETANFFFIISCTGAIVAEVPANGFNWGRTEGITEITSGPNIGKFGMPIFDTQARPHFYIFRIDDSGGTPQAHLEKDIFIPDWDFASPTYVDSAHPDPSLRDHFVISGGHMGNPCFIILNNDGAIEASSPLTYHEGLAYISAGPFQGKFIASDWTAEDSWIGNWDGTDKILYTLPGCLKIYPCGLRWLEQTGQLLVLGYAWTPDFHLNFLSRLGPAQWQSDNILPYSGLNSINSIDADLTAGKYYMFGRNRVGGVTKYRVHILNSNFEFLEERIIPDVYQNCGLSSINYIPGSALQSDKLAFAGSKTKIYLFDPLLSVAPTIIDIPGITGVTDWSYDAANRRHYLLDSGLFVRVYDESWNLITTLDVSPFVPTSFNKIAKVTSGDLKGNIVLLNLEDCELVFVHMEYQVAKSQLQKLIGNIQASGTDKGFMNSLIQKLKGAIDAVNKKNITAAVNKIEGFQNEVRAQSGKKIPAVTALIWLDQADAIIMGLRNL